MTQGKTDTFNTAWDVLIIGGGIIPPEDIPYLKERGVSEIFRPGAMLKDIADYIRHNVRRAS